MNRPVLVVVGLLIAAVLVGTIVGPRLLGGPEQEGEEAPEEPQAAAEPVTITYKSGTDTTPYMPEAIQMFEEEFPNIRVNWVQMPQESDRQHDQYVTELISRSAETDVYSIDIIWPAEFAAAGWLEPLNDRLSDEEWEEFLPGPIDGVTFEGQIYAVPWYTDGGVLYYRQDVLETLGLEPPETWEEIIEISRQALQQNLVTTGFTWQGNQYEGLVCNFLEYLWSNNGQVLDDEGEVVINSPEAIEAVAFMRRLIEEDISPEAVTTYIEEDSRQPFNAGEVLFHRNWPYVWSTLAEEESTVTQEQVGIVPMPRGPQGDSGAATLGGWNLAINVYSNNKDEAWEFVNFITSLEQQILSAELSGRFPTRIAAYDDEGVNEANPHFAAIFPALENARPRPVSPVYPEISDALQISIHKALTNRSTPEEAMDEAESRITEILTSANARQ